MTWITYIVGQNSKLKRSRALDWQLYLSEHPAVCLAELQREKTLSNSPSG